MWLETADFSRASAMIQVRVPVPWQKRQQELQQKREQANELPNLFVRYRSRFERSLAMAVRSRGPPRMCCTLNGNLAVVA